MRIKLKVGAVREIAILMAPNKKENPYYLNADNLVAFFKGFGMEDQYVWTDGKGITTSDIGEGLSRLNYVLGRMIDYNKSGKALEVVLQFASLFENNLPLMEDINHILITYKVNTAFLLENGTWTIKETKENDIDENMTLFISYSHDDIRHKAWVKQLANDLQTAGFNVLLDQFNPSGSSLTLFMNEGIEKADKVLVIGTPGYCRKSKQQSGGASYEGAIMSVTLFQNLASTKIVPILRKGSFETSFPILIGDRVGFDFSKDDDYEDNLQEMIKKFSEERSL